MTWFFCMQDVRISKLNLKRFASILVRRNNSTVEPHRTYYVVQDQFS